MGLKKIGSLGGMTNTSLSCGLYLTRSPKMKRKWAEKFQGAPEVISKAARTSVYRSNSLPSQCRHCLSLVKKEEALRPYKYFFLVLATLNFIVWLSWTLECSLRTIHGMYTNIYGVPGSILFVYSTLPFVFFNFAHVKAVFLDQA